MKGKDLQPILLYPAKLSFRGEKWDNCNSLINKIHLKKEKENSVFMVNRPITLFLRLLDAEQNFIVLRT